MPRRHPIQDTRDAVCLLAYLDGWTTQELAEHIGRSERTIQRWIARAREIDEAPDLELWMSGAGKACIHGKPIVRGMPVLCLDCMETGMADHPAFKWGKISTVNREGAPAEIAKALAKNPPSTTDQPDGPAKFRPKTSKRANP